MICQRLFGKRCDPLPQNPTSARVSGFVHQSIPFLSQPLGKYHFTSDTLALAEFVRIDPNESLLDLGTGAAEIPMLVWYRSTFRLAVGVELQLELVRCARENVRRNSLADHVFIIEKDIRELTTKDFAYFPFDPIPDKFDVISANPPFHPVGTGRLSPDLQRAISRHEICLTLGQLIQVCLRFLAPAGRFYLVNLAERAAELRQGLEAGGLELTREQQVPRNKDRILLESRWRRQ